AADLYLRVRLAPHPRYRVDGRDVTVDLPVTPWEAALGASVPVDTPGGTATVDLPPGSSSGRRLRLRGRGMPNPRGQPGDLYAEVKIVVPPRPTQAERDLFERLAKESRFDPRNPPSGRG
ncbi:DnaJ C-terminal domain-containing protein, partial [Streptomyces katrae]